MVIDTKEYKVFDKNIYSAVNEELEQYIKQNDINEVYLCGFDTDENNKKNAIDLFERNMEIVENIVSKIMVCKLHCTKEPSAAEVMKEYIDGYLY